MPRTAWNKKLTPEIEDLIVTQYQAGRTANEILATIPFRTRKTVYDVLERHGVARREGLGAYKRYNQAAFANVASEPAAYWLGLLITDGYILDTHGGGEIQIGLQLTDRELIEGFAEFVGKSGPIQTIEPRSPDHKTMYRVTISSNLMANHLARFGVVPRKSRVTFLPILERRLMPHLIRGIFDGDGTASHRSDGGLLLGFCGSERLITELRIWFISCLGISANTIHRVNSAFVVQWTARDDVRSIAAYLYSDASVFLERKRRLVKELL